MRVIKLLVATHSLYAWPGCFYLQLQQYCFNVLPKVLALMRGITHIRANKHHGSVLHQQPRVSKKRASNFRKHSLDREVER